MNRESVHGMARLHMIVQVQTSKGKVETEYLLLLLDDEESQCPAWRLVKQDGNFYDVNLAPGGPECTCPDFIFARHHIGINRDGGAGVPCGDSFLAPVMVGIRRHIAGLTRKIMLRQIILMHNPTPTNRTRQ